MRKGYDHDQGGEISMYLIRYDLNIIGIAQLVDLLEFSSCPNPAGWVVRAAEEHHSRLRAGELLFKILEIHPVGVCEFIIDQRVIDCCSSMTFNDAVEWLIHRCLHHDSVPRLCGEQDKICNG